MYAVMFETKNSQTEDQLHILLTQNEFIKCALPGSNIYRHKSDNMLNVYMMIMQILKEYRGKVDQLFVCKMDDVSDFSDLC